MKKGKIYLVPVTLGNEDFNQVIPGPVLSVTRSLRVFAVEDLRSARRYLRLIDRNFPIDDSVFLELNEHTAEENIVHYLDHAMDGSDIGIMSEAGVPGLADHGAKLVAAAHRKKLNVVPLTGPSSIVLALISSGLNGQNFTFNGYLPVKPAERNARLRDLERKAREGYAQIFMETPYRNQKMLESVLQTCSGDTKLCIAADITLPGETISTMTISEWRKNIPSIGGHLVVFILQ